MIKYLRDRRSGGHGWHGLGTIDSEQMLNFNPINYFHFHLGEPK